MRRGFWFAVGAASGVYVLTKARRTAESFTPEGLRDRLAGLSVGAHLFGTEVRTEMVVRERELRQRLKLEVSGRDAIETANPDTPADTPADTTRSSS
ncbi:MAG: DUF6167 family protein [Actinomycetota bacterium]|nr:DUF6167 family protein [Actinomycetota bacterium]